jgi:hypothetical protein
VVGGFIGLELKAVDDGDASSDMAGDERAMKTPI